MRFINPIARIFSKVTGKLDNMIKAKVSVEEAGFTKKESCIKIYMLPTKEK